jgi:hypothetical protein
MNVFDEEMKLASQEDAELVTMLLQAGCSPEEGQAFVKQAGMVN